MTIGKSLHAQRIRQQQAIRQQQSEARKREAQQQTARQSAKQMVDKQESRIKPLKLNWQRETKPQTSPTSSRSPLSSQTLQTGQALRSPQANETPAQQNLQKDFQHQLRFAQFASPFASLGKTNGDPLSGPTALSSPDSPTSAFAGLGPLAADGPANNDLTPAQQQAVETASTNVQNEVDDIDPNANKDERRDATLEASQAFETQLALLDPALHDAFLQEVGPALDTLTANADVLTGEQTEQFIGNLSRAAERVGPDSASAITDPIAANMPAILEEHGDNKGEFRDAVRDSIANGDGAVFGASLIESLQQTGQTDMANEIAKGTADGIQAVREDFESKQQDVDQLNAELGQFVAEWSDVLSEDELNQAIGAFRDKHAATYDAWENSGQTLATTFEGAGELITQQTSFASLNESGELLKQVEEGLSLLPAAAQIPSVQDLIAKGIDEDASYIKETASFLYDAAGDVNKARSQADNFAKAIFQVTAGRAEDLIKNQDLAGLEELFTDFQDAARGLGVAGVNKPEQLDELTQLIRDARNQTPPDFEAFSTAFAEKAGKLKGQVFAEGSAAKNAFGTLGLVVSAGALVSDVRNFTDAELENQLQTIVDAVDLGADAYKLFRNPTAFKALGRVTGGISAALGAVDAIRYGLDGDYANAGLSAAGVVGSILLTTSAGGPVGTAIGAAISVGVVAGSFALSHHRSNQAEDRSEENLEAFLQGAGFTADQAHRLRDVTHLSHQSIGRIFSQLGEQQGIDGRQLLDDFLATVPHDQQDNFVDAIEALHRNDEGLFTQTSLDAALAIFQHYGVLPSN